MELCLELKIITLSEISQVRKISSFHSCEGSRLKMIIKGLLGSGEISGTGRRKGEGMVVIRIEVHTQAYTNTHTYMKIA
jgi:hypothetical protein